MAWPSVIYNVMQLKLKIYHLIEKINFRVGVYMKKLWLFGFFAVALGFGYWTINNGSQTRSIASYGYSSYGNFPSVDELPADYKSALEEEAARNGGTIEIPPHLTADQADDLWHLSEGADIYPMKWLMALKSQVSSQKGSPFLTNLDQKFGAIKDPYPQSRFPLKWIGLSAAWSEASPMTADVTVAPGGAITEEHLRVRVPPPLGSKVI